MIDKNLESRIRSGEVRQVYACLMTKWLTRGLSKFAKEAGKFWRQLEKIEPKASFEMTTTSTSAYRLILPTGMSPDSLDRAIRLLRDSRLEFYDKEHFGALF